MKSHIDVKTQVTLLLSEEEARWLKGIMQNPFFQYENQSDEPQIDRDMRFKFFEAVEDIDKVG